MNAQTKKPRTKTPNKKKRISKSCRLSFLQILIISSSAIVTILVLVLAFLRIYIFDRYNQTVTRLQPIILDISANMYLEMGYKEEIDISAKNNGSKNVNTTFGVLDDGSCPVIIKHIEINKFFNGIIQPNQRLEGSVLIFIPVDITILNKQVGLSLWGNVNDNPVIKLTYLPMKIPPIPYHRHIFYGIFVFLAPLLVANWSVWLNHKGNQLKRK